MLSAPDVPVTPMTTQLLLWLFSGVSIMHLIAAALVWVAVFVPGKLGFKEDSMLRICIGIYLICEAVVTLLAPGGSISLVCTLLGGAALFFGIGRLIRWLVHILKNRKKK